MAVPEGRYAIDRVIDIDGDLVLDSDVEADQLALSTNEASPRAAPPAAVVAPRVEALVLRSSGRAPEESLELPHRGGAPEGARRDDEGTDIDGNELQHPWTVPGGTRTIDGVRVTTLLPLQGEQFQDIPEGPGQATTRTRS